MILIVVLHLHTSNRMRMAKALLTENVFWCPKANNWKCLHCCRTGTWVIYSKHVLVRNRIIPYFKTLNLIGCYTVIFVPIFWILIFLLNQFITIFYCKLKNFAIFNHIFQVMTFNTHIEKVFFIYHSIIPFSYQIVWKCG